MKALPNPSFWLIVSLLFATLIYFLSPILTPFLLGALLAYLINPVVRLLEKLSIPHLLSVILVFAAFVGLMLIAIFTIYPYVVYQLDVFINFIPVAYEWILNTGLPWLAQHINIAAFKSALPTTFSKSTWVVSTFLKSGTAAMQSMVSFILTPVITFYLLRDWDKVMSNLQSLLPKASAPIITQLAKDCDEVLGAFIRGQLLVMLCLSFIYSIGLTIIGLKFGFIIGIVGGLLSIVPYLGSAFVLISSLISAYMQAGFESLMTWALIIFLIGQTLEGYLLTPYLVGDRIGLHPIAVIFAVMAGGTLFGFVGVLLALPVAAILMAIFRFFRGPASAP